MCTSPSLLRVIDIPNALLIPRLEELGFKIDEFQQKAYKFIPHSSRDLPLEEIPEYLNQSLIEIGCGGCIDCRLKYSKDWANRCHLESLLYSHNYFLTLTYNDDNLPIGDLGNPTLVKKDLTDFIHSLRDKFRNDFGFIGVRYFGCGEYGDQTFRPHYHLILFNCPLPDVTTDIQTDEGQIIHKKSSISGLPYLWSKIVHDCWNKGNIILDNCNWNTSAYVSRYVLKKQTGEKGREVYDKQLGIVAPYVCMSTKPGIGLDYFLKHENDFYKDPHIYAPRRSSSLVSSLPRYFMKKIKQRFPDIHDDIVTSAKSSTDAQRSLIRGKHLINDVRSDREVLNKSRSNIFQRNNIK